MSIRPYLAIALTAGLAAGCAEKPAPAPAAPAPAPQAAIKAENCVNLRQIKQSVVRSDRVIDFEMLDGRTLRNTLPNRCPSLGFEKAFSYSTSLSQLCSTDIITVIQQGGGIRRGAACGLGQFVPVSEAEAKAELPADLK